MCSFDLFYFMSALPFYAAAAVAVVTIFVGLSFVHTASCRKIISFSFSVSSLLLARQSFSLIFLISLSLSVCSSFHSHRSRFCPTQACTFCSDFGFPFWIVCNVGCQQNNSSQLYLVYWFFFLLLLALLSFSFFYRMKHEKRLHQRIWSRIRIYRHHAIKRMAHCPWIIQIILQTQVCQSISDFSFTGCMRAHAQSMWVCVCARAPELVSNIVISVRKNCDRTLFESQRFIYSNRLHFHSIASRAFTYHISFVVQVIDNGSSSSSNNIKFTAVGSVSASISICLPPPIRLERMNTAWKRIALLRDQRNQKWIGWEWKPRKRPKRNNSITCLDSFVCGTLHWWRAQALWYISYSTRMHPLSF